MTWVEILRVIGIGFAFVMPTAFCTCYHVWTRGHWKDSRYGVHLMVFSGVFALIMLYVLLTVIGVVPHSWRPYAGLVIYFTGGALFLWRFVLLAHDHRTANAATSPIIKGTRDRSD